ncbi:MAG: hypothetical protein JWP97_4427 [Labilithrix sp.]|nr:hypothetical protein [Labilithrix sp.]
MSSRGLPHEPRNLRRALSTAAFVLAGILTPACVDLFHSTDFDTLCTQDPADERCASNAEAGARPDARPTDGQPGDEARDGSPDAIAALTCRGKPFQTPLRVGTADISAAIATTMWGVRVVGSNAFFAATPAGTNEQQLFRATFTPAGAVSAPSLSNASVISPPSSTAVVEWAPSVSSNGTLLVFATAFPPPRDLAVALGAGGVFAAATDIGSVNTSADETDPCLVGAPSATAMYFGRENGSNAMEIWRAAVDGTTFSTPTKLALACAEMNCGTPVVTPDEGTIFYASWASGGFVPDVVESTLVAAGGSWSVGPAVLHPELGTHYPSWVSDDGCELLLGGGNISSVNDIYYARRVAR